jgi:hypothetical protein
MSFGFGFYLMGIVAIVFAVLVARIPKITGLRIGNW